MAQFPYTLAELLRQQSPTNNSVGLLGTPQPTGLLSQLQQPSALARALQYGKRQDGTQKGKGFFGELPNGKDYSTELSIGVNMGGKEMQIPSMVPTLSADELRHLLSGNAPTPQIVQKAVDHARQRLMTGRSPFADPTEIYPLPEGWK